MLSSSGKMTVKLGKWAVQVNDLSDHVLCGRKLALTVERLPHFDQHRLTVACMPCQVAVTVNISDTQIATASNKSASIETILSKPVQQIQHVDLPRCDRCGRYLEPDESPHGAHWCLKCGGPFYPIIPEVDLLPPKEEDKVVKKVGKRKGSGFKFSDVQEHGEIAEPPTLSAQDYESLMNFLGDDYKVVGSTATAQHTYRVLVPMSDILGESLDESDIIVAKDAQQLGVLVYEIDLQWNEVATFDSANRRCMYRVRVLINTSDEVGPVNVTAAWSGP